MIFSLYILEIYGWEKNRQKSTKTKNVNTRSYENVLKNNNFEKLIILDKTERHFLY